MATMSPRRSHRLRIATALAMAMLLAGCASSREAGPTEPTSKVAAGTTSANRQSSLPSPARSGSLAYGVDGDIYVADWDGSNPVRIAEGGEGPIWSPDGRYLAYRRANDDVVISDPKGNVIAEFPGEGWDISWSPDSTRVAVWVRFGRTIGVFGIDGERQALLTKPRGFCLSGDHDPTWSPDGKSLLLQGVVIPIDGSTPYTLSWTRGTPSPDGSRVAYARPHSFVVAEAGCSKPRVVFDRSVWDPVWSPAGDRIAFLTPKRVWPLNQLRVLDVATGTVTLLAEAGGSWDLGISDFSPDGHRILFRRSNRRVDVGSLWSVNADGSDAPRRLVAGSTSGDWLSPGPTP